MTTHSFIAATARDALARVRSALGDDAVVLATRDHARGVEILASAYADLTRVEAAPAEPVGGSRILRELLHLRGLLQNQLAGFAWNAARRRHPQRVAILQTLFAAGFGSALARTLAARMPRTLHADAVAHWLRQVLIRNLPLLDAEADPIAHGGVYALVGPTGAGKTTSLAKLAARGVARYGAAEVGLIAADAYRVGAVAQVQVYADLLGVECLDAADDARLREGLQRFAHKRLVLIDSAGFSPVDQRVAALQLLDALGVTRVLVLAANMQSAAIEHTLTHYGVGARACILGKWDEAPQPGAALDSLIRHRLPLAYVSAGQRVPEDLYPPNAAYLIDRALKGAQLATPYALKQADWPLFAGVEAGREQSSDERRRVG